tara:strand:+ start:1011 stop:1529 length:519 start_codon:yes stop_codon:yes gene_type:complete
MKRAVEKEQFWDDRIDTAKKRGMLHHSIYESPPELWKAMEDRHKRIILEHVGSSESVLDIACGYGRFSNYFDSSSYVGVDFSKSFINIAKENNPNHKFTQSRIETLPFGDYHFEWGFGVSIKAMIIRENGQDSWDVMEKELRRVCKNLIFLEYSDGKGNHLVEDYEVINCPL